MSIFKRFTSLEDIFESGNKTPEPQDVPTDAYGADLSDMTEPAELLLSPQDKTDDEAIDEIIDQALLEGAAETIDDTTDKVLNTVLTDIAEDTQPPEEAAFADGIDTELALSEDSASFEPDDWIEEWVAPFEDAPNEDKLQVLPETADDDENELADLKTDIADDEIAKLALTEALEDDFTPEETEEITERLSEYERSDITTEYAPTHSDGLNLGELRLDIVRITSDIESGETLYRRAQQRIDSLMGFLEKAEVGLSALKRLEPEARHLKIENRSLKTDLEAKQYTTARLESELKEQRETANQASLKIEDLHHTLTALKLKVDEKHQEIDALTTAKDDETVKAERIKTDLDIQVRENTSLREKMTDLVAHIDRLNGQRLELMEATENFRVEYGDIQDRQNTLETQNAKLLLNLRRSERQNDEVRSEMVEVQNKIMSFKGHHQQQVLTRDDRIASLESKLAELERRLKHKDDVLKTQAFEVSDLRKSKARHDIDKEKLENVVASQTVLLSKADEDLRKARRDVSTLSARCKDLTQATAMANLSDTQPTPRRSEIVSTPEVHVARDALSTSKNFSSPFLDLENP